MTDQLDRALSRLYNEYAKGLISFDELSRREDEIRADSTKNRRIAAQTRRREHVQEWRSFRHKLPISASMHLTDARASALEGLIYLIARDSKDGDFECQVPVAAIAAVAKVSERSVRLMLSVAEDLKLIEREHVRIKAYRNAPNVYRIIEGQLQRLVARLKARFARESGQEDARPQSMPANPAKPCSVSREDLSSLPTSPPANANSTPAPAAESRKRADAPDRRDDFKAGTSPRHERGAHAPRNAWQFKRGGAAPYLDPQISTRMAIAALEILKIPRSGGHWTEAVEDLLRSRHPDIAEGYWKSRIRLHGPRAYLAVLEAALKKETRDEKPIRNETAYLIGILRCQPDECRPDVSVQKILEAA